MTSDNSENELRWLDIERESRYAYWNALLTLNGILITVFSGIALLGHINKWLIFALVVSCIVSAWLLISNFMKMKKVYSQLGQMDLNQFENMSEPERNADFKKAQTQHNGIERNENIVRGLLFVQALLILVLFFV